MSGIVTSATGMQQSTNRFVSVGNMLILTECIVNRLVFVLVTHVRILARADRQTGVRSLYQMRGSGLRLQTERAPEFLRSVHL